MNRVSVTVIRQTFLLLAFVSSYNWAGFGWCQDSEPSEIKLARDAMREMCFMYDLTDVNQELAMTDSELKQLDEMTAKLFRELSDTDRNPEKAEKFKAAKFNAKLDDELEKIIGRQRLGRQKQLAARIEFRKNGLGAAVSKYSKSKIVLRGRNLSKYQRACRAAAQELGEKKEELRQECMAELTNLLTPAQRAQMQDFLTLAQIQYRPPELERIAWQLVHLDSIRKTLQVSELTSFEEMLWEGPAFRNGTSGTTRCSLAGFRNNRNDGALAADDVYERLSDRALDRIPTHLLDAAQAEQREQLLTRQQQFLDSEESRVREKRIEFGKEVLKQVESMLREDQIKHLKLISSRYMLDSGGFVACVTAGELGQHLGISPKQVAEFDAKANEWVEKIVTKSLEWEEEILQELIASLPKKFRGEVKKLVGPKPEKIRPNLDRLVEILSDP